MILLNKHYDLVALYCAAKLLLDTPYEGEFGSDHVQILRFDLQKLGFTEEEIDGFSFSGIHIGRVSPLELED